MMDLQRDPTKFAMAKEKDKNNAIEKHISAPLRKLWQNYKTDAMTFERTRPVRSTIPRIDGLPNHTKQLLQCDQCSICQAHRIMIKVRWRGETLEPIRESSSTNCLRDTSQFVDAIRDVNTKSQK